LHLLAIATLVQPKSQSQDHRVIPPLVSAFFQRSLQVRPAASSGMPMQVLYWLECHKVSKSLVAMVRTIVWKSDSLTVDRFHCTVTSDVRWLGQPCYPIVFGLYFSDSAILLPCYVGSTDHLIQSAAHMLSHVQLTVWGGPTIQHSTAVKLLYQKNTGQKNRITWLSQLSDVWCDSTMEPYGHRSWVYSILTGRSKQWWQNKLL